MQPLRIATRNSALALWQAGYVQQQLQQLHPDVPTKLVPLTSQGDQLLATPLTKIGGKGLFVKELETALLDGRADIAVHSMKDVPMTVPAGLCLAVICRRDDPRDALVSPQYASLSALPPNARVGTSSLRRQCQLLALRPDLTVCFLRGNVNSRLAKLDQGQFAAIVLAAAGLSRLGLSHRIRHWFSVHDSIPAVGQGAIGIERRCDDARSQQLIAPLHHEDTALCVYAERAMNRRLQGSCQVPIGGFAQRVGDSLQIQGLVGRPDGSLLLKASTTVLYQDYEAAGIAVADSLLAQGADAILAALR